MEIAQNRYQRTNTDRVEVARVQVLSIDTDRVEIAHNLCITELNCLAKPQNQLGESASIDTDRVEIARIDSCLTVTDSKLFS